MHYPSVKLVDKIAHREHPVARFCDQSRPQRIEFSIEECKKLPPDVLRFAVYHELGHWWRLANVPRSRKIFVLFPVVESENGEERFADGFAHYFLNRRKLESDAPRAEEFVRLCLGNHEDDVREFAEDTFDWLESEITKINEKEGS